MLLVYLEYGYCFKSFTESLLTWYSLVNVMKSHIIVRNML